MYTIRELRESRKMTQQELANEIGVTVATAYQWDSRRIEPRATQLRQIARLFGVSMDDIDFEAINRKSRRKDDSEQRL